ALAGAAPRPLTTDWRAWSSIITLGYAGGTRTPFREIERLQAGTVAVAAPRPSVTDTWSWSAIQPECALEPGAEAVLDELRASVRSLPAGTLICQLTGGLDSRLCLGLLAEARVTDLVAITAQQDRGHDAEERVAAEIARLVGVPHEEVGEP